MADTKTYDPSGNLTSASYAGEGVDEAAQDTQKRQEATRRKIAKAAASEDSSDMPKSTGDLATDARAMREWREKKNATPQKQAIKAKLASP